jgi:hypothetical protein
MNEKIKIEQSNSPQTWNNLFALGASKSIYFHYDFISSLDCPFRNYLIYKNNELIAGFTSTLNANEDSIIDHEFSIYSGFYFSERHNKKINKKRIERIEVINHVLEEIGAKYNNINFTLSPDIEDIRPFQWFNYNEESFKFSSNIFYTSFLDLTKSKENLLKSLSSIRRQQIGYGTKESLKIVDSDNFSTLINNYQNNLSAQGEDYPEKYFENLLQLLIRLKKMNLIKLYTLIRDGKEAYSVVFSKIGDTSEYMYGSGNMNIQKSYDSTYLLWHVINEMKNDNKTRLNFEGVNSPNRGNYKLSFGGNLEYYFKIAKYSN